MSISKDADLRAELGEWVLTLTIDRPHRRNALSTPLLEALAAALIAAELDPEVRCVVLAGSDRVFASGADLGDLDAGDPAREYDGARARAWQAIRVARIPMVAAVSGFCLGGGLELAMCCDVIVVAESAKLGTPETALGLIPAGGATQRLPLAIGRAKALDLILSGRLLSGREAEQCGLVSRVAPDSEWLQSAAAVAGDIARRGPRAQLLAKETVRAAGVVPLEQGIELERRGIGLALGSAEAQEGIAAFLERRPPSWQSNG